MHELLLKVSFLGGTSGVLYQKALKQIYGEKTKNIIEGLKSNPAVAIATILTRLKSKEIEWREAQKGLNKIWREQNEKYYLKSLDHQGINFKPTDLRALMSNRLFDDIETLFHERHERKKHGREVMTGPHIVIPYKDSTILNDAANLLIHCVKRKTNIQKSEKNQIKQLLLRTVPDFFFHPRQHLSNAVEEDEKQKEGPRCCSNNNTKNATNRSISPAHIDVDEDEEERLLHAKHNDTEEAYTLFMGNNNWYIFLRLHAILCDRLAKIYERSVILAEEEAKQQSKRKESTAISLRLKQQLHIDVQEYYPAFLDIVKTLLDGNIDSDIYEDTLREMYGIYAYIAFTLDSVISYAVRQLQHCVTEKTASACTDLFMEEQKKCTSGGCKTVHMRTDAEFAYQRAAQKAVLDEKCFKFCFYKKDCRMSIELLETKNDDIERVQERTKMGLYKKRAT